jgi:phage shock protein A
MISKAALLEKLSQLEQQIAKLKRLIETAEGASKPTKSKHASLHGKFPQLKALTEADIDEATQIWEKVPHEF